MTNTRGQLGDGTYAKTNRPEQIVSTGVIAIAAGFTHSLFFKSDGSLWAMGDDSYGQLGLGNFSSRTNRPVQVVPSGVLAIAVGGNTSLFLQSGGSFWDNLKRNLSASNGHMELPHCPSQL